MAAAANAQAAQTPAALTGWNERYSERKMSKKKAALSGFGFLLNCETGFYLRLG